MKKTISGNMLYLLNILWKTDRSTSWSIQPHILPGVTVPFISILISSVIINLLLKEYLLSTFIFVLGGLLLLYGILQGLVSYLNEYNVLAFIKSCGLYFIRNVYLERAHLDYALLENEEYRETLEDAVEVTEVNNNKQEGMFHDFIIFATSLLGLILYAPASSRFSTLFVLGLLPFVVLQYTLFFIARHYEYSHHPELDGYPIETRYLNQIAYDTVADKDIHLYRLQDWTDNKFEHINRLIARIRARDYSAYMLMDTLEILLGFVRDITCYVSLINQLIAGVAIDKFVFHFGTISGSSLQFRKVEGNYVRMSVNNMLTNRIRVALQMKNRAHYGGSIKLDQKEITITLDHASFSYLNQDRSILNDISSTLHMGQKLALVGVSGAGESTIAKLILGFYIPSAGNIHISGANTHELDLDDLYVHITRVLRDTVVLSYSTAENVSTQDITDADLRRVKDCLKRCGLWNFISALPQQELTHASRNIEENGIQLFGGQK